jgi:hypothetical protein
MNALSATLLLASMWLMAAHAPAQTNTVPPFARGTVVKLDPKSGELLLNSGATNQTYWLSPRTYIFRGDEKLTADKLKPGDLLKLRVVATPTGLISVVRIKVDTNAAPLPPLTLP